jgi:CRISPR-associated endonuclease/helicase Cas3
MIIVNNVGKAIELYKKLEKEVENNSLYLLHSRLIEKEKGKRIQTIKDKLDAQKKSGAENDGIIVVATQVVEASVDVDFDILITETSPIDSQIQRWGRVYRNREKEYTEETPNVYIITNIDEGTRAIYDEKVIEKTVEILKRNGGGLLDYQRERQLIDCVFKEKIDDLTLEEKYVEEIKKNLDWLNYYSVEKRSEAQRVFRKIAGLQVVIPLLMKDSSDLVENELYAIITEKEKRELSWDEIVKEINGQGQNVEKWDLMKRLYENSVGLPMFAVGKNEYIKNKSLDGEFKGFSILRDSLFKERGKEKEEERKKRENEKKEEIVKYGINKLVELDIDEEEINIVSEESYYSD